MTLDPFEELLKELSKVLGVSLHLDKHRACRLNISNIVHVQIEHDPAKERLLVAAFIGELPAGKFRENFLKEALKNNYSYPRTATLAFCERNNQLSFFDYLPFHNMNGQKLGEYLVDFIEQSVAWRQGVDSGRVPSPKKR